MQKQINKSENVGRASGGDAIARRVSMHSPPLRYPSSTVDPERRRISGRRCFAPSFSIPPSNPDWYDLRLLHSCPDLVHHISNPAGQSISVKSTGRIRQMRTALGLRPRLKTVCGSRVRLAPRPSPTEIDYRKGLIKDIDGFGLKASRDAFIPLKIASLPSL